MTLQATVRPTRFDSSLNPATPAGSGAAPAQTQRNVLAPGTWGAVSSYHPCAHDLRPCREAVFIEPPHDGHIASWASAPRAARKVQCPVIFFIASEASVQTDSSVAQRLRAARQAAGGAAAR